MVAPYVYAIVMVVFFCTVPSSHQFTIASENLLLSPESRDLASKAGGSCSLGTNSCIKISSRCYCLVPTQSTWLNAYQYCQSNGMKLLSIETSDESKDLINNLNPILLKNPIVVSIGVWTSGTYLDALNTFIWVGSLNLFTFVNWQSGMPTLAPFECVRNIPSANSIWADTDCGQWLPFVCESS